MSRKGKKPEMKNEFNETSALMGNEIKNNLKGDGYIIWYISGKIRKMTI